MLSKSTHWSTCRCFKKRPNYGNWAKRQEGTQKIEKPPTCRLKSYPLELPQTLSSLFLSLSLSLSLSRARARAQF